MTLNLAVIGPEAAFLRVPGQGGPEDRPGPKGGPGSRPRRRTPRDTHPAPVPTTPPPCRRLRARFAGTGTSLRGARVVLPGIPHPYTHPYTHPGTPTQLPTVDSTADVDGTTAACTYGRFRRSVGEPRGVRTHCVSGSQTGLYCIWEITRPFDWV